MKPKEIIGTIGGIVALVVVCFGIYFWAIGEFASAQGLKDANQKIERTNERIDQQINERKYDFVQERIFKYEGIADKRKLTDMERQDLEKLKTDKERLLKVLSEPVGVKK